MQYLILVLWCLSSLTSIAIAKTNFLWICRSIHLLFYWILFENVMSMHRTKATWIGLLEAGRANEWVVTEKLGDSATKNKSGDASKNKTNAKSAPKRLRFRFADR